MIRVGTKAADADGPITLTVAADSRMQAVEMVRCHGEGTVTYADLRWQGPLPTSGDLRIRGYGVFVHEGDTVRRLPPDELIGGRFVCTTCRTVIVDKQGDYCARCKLIREVSA